MTLAAVFSQGNTNGSSETVRGLLLNGLNVAKVIELKIVFMLVGEDRNAFVSCPTSMNRVSQRHSLHKN